jgi:hypothetical protein
VGGWLTLAGLGPERIGKDVVGFGGVVQGGKKPRVGAELAEAMAQLHQRRHASAGERPPPALPALDGVPVHPELLGERLLRQAGGLPDELEQEAGNEASRGRPSGLRPPPVRVASDANMSAEPGCALSAGICLFLTSLSGRPELVPPVSGTANLLILTCRYDGPNQPNRAAERRQV